MSAVAITGEGTPKWQSQRPCGEIISGAVVVVGTQLIGRVARLITQQVETGTIEAINPWAQRTARLMYCAWRMHRLQGV